ncbi:MAG: cyclic nucleotide-binding domain-containing protein [Acidobacteria bacterium]|nr:cyclic nucleotide-binding domain-containing protein [Acidobacteriota bacterium]
MNDPQYDSLCPQLTPEDLDCLRQYGSELHFEIGERLFSEGDPGSDCFFVLLSGKVRVTKRVSGGELTLVTHEAGQFTGEIGIFTDDRAFATARAMTAVNALQIPIAGLKKLVSQCPSVASIIMPALIHRRPEVMAAFHQREKLAALGKLSAGLAHELNNPAAAIIRAASQLRGVLARLSAAVTGPDSPVSNPYTELRTRALSGPPLRLDPITQSDLEDALSAWLEAQEVAEPWNLAPTLVACGLSPADLKSLEKNAAGDCFPETVARLAADLTAARIIGDIEEAADRLLKVVKAVKSYSYMDQAAVQEANLNEGIDNTLTMFAHQFKRGVTVVRQFDPQLPLVMVAVGELNQVWTNLIDNALDALDGSGTLTVRTSTEGDSVLVEIIDDGPGIPPEIQSRMFEPFFTTKPMGDGSGLGLDIVWRIIRRHGGDIRCFSKPGETRFSVRLPLSSKLELHEA